jgi:hypothetical protein
MTDGNMHCPVVQVSIQHPNNREDAITCAHCHQFVGSIELQISQLLSSVARRGGLLKTHEQSATGPGSSSDAGPSISNAHQHEDGSQEGSESGSEEVDDDEERQEVEARTHLVGSHLFLTVHPQAAHFMHTLFGACP